MRSDIQLGRIYSIIKEDFFLVSAKRAMSCELCTLGWDSRGRVIHATRL